MELIALTTLISLTAMAFALGWYTKRINKRARQIGKERVLNATHGVFVQHGMVRSAPGTRGVQADKAHSDTFYECIG